MCLSMQRDWVCVGDSTAKLHVLNPKNDFELVKSYSTEHTKGITGVHLTHGCLITSSTDGTVRISSPTDPPKPIATLLSGFGEIASVRFAEKYRIIDLKERFVKRLRVESEKCSSKSKFSLTFKF